MDSKLEEATEAALEYVRQLVPSYKKKETAGQHLLTLARAVETLKLESHNAFLKRVSEWTTVQEEIKQIREELRVAEDRLEQIRRALV